MTINGGLNVTNNLRTIPGDTEDVKIGISYLIDTPVYWKLPKQFLGDKVNFFSYTDQFNCKINIKNSIRA